MVDWEHAITNDGPITIISACFPCLIEMNGLHSVICSYNARQILNFHDHVIMDLFHAIDTDLQTLILSF